MFYLVVETLPFFLLEIMNKAFIWPRAVIFDAEGVVVDTESLWDKAMDQLFKMYGRVYNRAEIKPQIAGRAMPSAMAHLNHLLALDADVEKMVEDLQNIVGELFADEIACIPGFCDFFQFLRLQNIPVCIATSMAPALMDKVCMSIDLRSMFDGKVYHVADVQGRSKPAPDLFLYAADKLSTEPRHCIVIEDSPNGITAALSAGMTAVGLATTFDAGKIQHAHYVVNGYDELLGMFCGEQEKCN